MRINLIAASRQRPDRMSTILEKWLESADNSKSIKVVISIDDSECNTCQSLHSRKLQRTYNQKGLPP
jgi:hypothetical protein